MHLGIWQKMLGPRRRGGETELELHISKLHNRIQSLFSSDNQVLENDLTLTCGKLDQAQKFFQAHLSSKDATIANLRIEIALKNTVITKKDNELDKVNTYFCTYKPTVDRDGRLSDSRALLMEKNCKHKESQSKEGS